jgi:hypothetical protein
MIESIVSCPKCQTPLPTESFNSPNFVPCTNCAAPLRALVFPALVRTVGPGATGQPLLSETEASCYYHPEKKASVPCDRCGRFLCGLCDLDLEGGHVCPSCLSSAQQKGSIQNLQHHRVLYDDIVFALALYPIVFVWPTLLTAPAALFLAVRHWKTPTSIIPRTKARMWAGVVLAGLQVIAWITLVTVVLIGIVG